MTPPKSAEPRPLDVLILHPPAVKPAEPPVGPAVLLGHLRGEGLHAEVIDASLEAFLWLLEPSRLARAAGPRPSTAVRRAIGNVDAALAQVRSPAAVASFERHKGAVRRLNRALSLYRGASGEERLTLGGDYRHPELSEFSPADLGTLARGEASTLFAEYFREVLVPQVVARRPRIVGLSIIYRHQVLPAFELAGMLRRALPEARVVGGGGMISSWAPTLRAQGIALEGFDTLVFGPGEAALATMAREARAAGPAQLSASPAAGPAQLSASPAAGPAQLSATPAADPAQISAAGAAWREEPGDLAFAPDFDGAPVRAYLTPEPVLPITTSRGCYWRKCLFCPERAAPTTPYRCDTPHELVDRLPALARRHGVRHFHLTDDAVPPKVLRALADRADDLQGLSWYGFARFERSLRDPELIAGLARSGCAMLQLGLESGSQRVLDRLGKGTRVDDASVILRRLAAAGIVTYVYVMLGTPGETEEDAELTLRFLEDHAEYIGYLNLALMNLPRGAELLEEPERHGIRSATLLGDDKPLSLYHGFEAENGWGRAEARRFLNERLVASPKLRGIVGRLPPLFNANHAVFFGPQLLARAA